MTKAEARVEFLERRKSLTEAERDVLNMDIYNRFFASGILELKKVVHIFLSMQRTGEPDTWQIIDRVRREMPQIRLVVPRINGDGNLEHIYFEGLHQLKQSNMGILEPYQGVPATVNKFDVVITPLVAFDVEGNRVGYGKGFYDRFLKDCRRDCKRVGISFFPPAEKFTDVEEHDVALNVCFTPNEVYEF